MVQRNGSDWEVESLDTDDVTVTKDGQEIAEWVGGNYIFSDKKVNEDDLMVIIDLVNQYRQKVGKRI